MGVFRLREKGGGTPVQVEITSRFDEGKQQFFLNYLLSKVFGGSLMGPVAGGGDDLWDMLLAFIFRHRLQEASAVGLFKQFRTFQRNDIRVRGRIDVARHLRRNTPFLGSVAYATHEITFDNSTNHLLRHAWAKVQQKWLAAAVGGVRLTEMQHQLEQNTPTWRRSDVLECIRHKENQTPIKQPYFQAHYEPLRRVALALLRHEGASLYQREQEAEGVIFDGSWLWEEYVWTLLREIEGFHHPRNKEQTGRWSTPPGVTFYPDFFHRDKRVVLDAKYRRPLADQDEERSQPIATQVFAYMFLLDAVHGGIINPEGNGTHSPSEITRQMRVEDRDAKKAWWHALALEPPRDLANASAFKTEMEEREKAFKKEVKKIMA
jgi:5-methylcytosine-specific restriction endonuclease McrBC regulatory subunit McrC